MEIIGEKKGAHLAGLIMNFIASIPRSFDIYIALPELPESFPSNIPLGKNISLIRFENLDDVPSGYVNGPLMTALFKQPLAIKQTYFRQKISGYSGYNLNNKSNAIALNNFKIFLQQGFSKKLFKPNSDKSKPKLGNLWEESHYQIPKFYLSFIDEMRSPSRITNIELPIDISRRMASLELNKEHKIFDVPENIGAPSQAIIALFCRHGKLIECELEEAKRIKSAIQWHFDSSVVENQTLAFLQVCIGLEALLGDDDSNGALTDTLADRCSYLIANNIAGRKTIKKNFRELYRIRSKLVHGVSTTPDEQQEYYLHWGRKILEIAINKEIKNLE